MKIATITFHWATNYGAVLQAFALQTFLKKENIKTEIIQYLPDQNIKQQRLQWLISGKIKNFKKERIINEFRRNFLEVSEDKYYSNKDLFEISEQYDIVICGSDQIWNFSFLEYAERNRQTLSYYLNFVGSKTRRISYATSFGSNNIPEKFKQPILQELFRFKNIGVREQSAKDLLAEIGIESQVVLDPTLLLTTCDYEKLLQGKKDKEKFEFFPFILHENQKMAEQCKTYILKNQVRFDKTYKNEFLSVEDWLYCEKHAKLILTNSFHSTVFAILFHTPFIVVPVEGSNMDARIKTLLETVGLEKFFLIEYNERELEQLMCAHIDWDSVDRKLKTARLFSQKFLLNAIEIE